ncbi:MAG: hypothetical protein QM687_16525 [Ferruginibacter sp.]
MQQDKELIQQLQKLENQQLPDLSRMDADWQNMQHMLQPAGGGSVVQSGAVWTKWLIAALAAAGTVTGIVLLQKDEPAPVAKQQIATAPGPQQTSTSTAAVPVNSAAVQVNTDSSSGPVATAKFHLSGHNNRVAPVHRDVYFADQIYDSYVLPVDSWEENLPQQNNTAVATESNKQVLLQEMFDGLSKPAQVFIIDNRKDTIVHCSEGTSLYVPAFAFNTTAKVQLNVTEYYRYSDFIANRLTTLSDKQQLVTGGMMNITASVEGKETDISRNSFIKVFIPGIAAKDSFSIFEGQETRDKEVGAADYSVDWELTDIPIDSPVFKMFVTALDLRDNLSEHPVFSTKGKLITRIPRSPKSSLSAKELKTLMKEKYPYYDKIKIKVPWKRNLLFKKREFEDYEYGNIVYNSYGIGDTAEFLPSTMRIYKLQPIDTVYHMVNRIRVGDMTKDLSFSDPEIQERIGEKYNIQLNRLGWINCDKFYRSDAPKTNFFVNLGDEAKNYYSILVFKDMRSAMSSTLRSGNKVVFENLPIGEPVTIVSMGINNEGKKVLAVAETRVSKNMFEGLLYHESSVPEIKQSLTRFD